MRPGLFVWAVLMAMPTVAVRGAADDLSTFTKVPFPPDAARPMEISVGMILVDFARINAREESFDISGYLSLSWKVPSLAGKGRRRMLRDDLWAPNIDFVNALEPVRLQNEVAFHVEDDGTVEERIRFSGKFATLLNLRRFPFDEQHLDVLIEPFERSVDDVVFRVEPKRVGRYETAFLSDWDILGVRARVSTNRQSTLDETRSRFVWTIDVRRKSTFYLWRVLTPLILLVVASWGIYWVDPAQLQPQISTAVAILLSIVVFNMTIDFALPKVAYLTFIDSHALMSYVFMLSSIELVIRIHHRLNVKGIEAARRLQRRARVLFPVAYVLVFAIEATFFLAIAGHDKGAEPVGLPPAVRVGVGTMQSGGAIGSGAEIRRDRTTATPGPGGDRTIE